VSLLIFIAVLAAAFATGFILRYRGMNWFVAWLVASLVIPAILYVSEALGPTGWFGVALIYGTIYGVALGGAGVFAAWVINRKWNGQAAP
jgi:hypothetical protein